MENLQITHGQPDGQDRHWSFSERFPRHWNLFDQRSGVFGCLWVPRAPIMPESCQHRAAVSAALKEFQAQTDPSHKSAKMRLLGQEEQLQQFVCKTNRIE